MKPDYREEFLRCWRKRMTQAETARYCGASPAAVCRFARREGIKFNTTPATVPILAREVPVENRKYPWDTMEVGDWFEAETIASAVAYYGNKTRAPKRFRSYYRGMSNKVVRVE